MMAGIAVSYGLTELLSNVISTGPDDVEEEVSAGAAVSELPPAKSIAAHIRMLTKPITFFISLTSKDDTDETCQSWIHNMLPS